MPTSGAIVAERLLRERAGHQVLLGRFGDGGRVILRRFPVDAPPFPNERARALERIRRAALPGLAPILGLRMHQGAFEVQEAFVEGFSLGAAIDAVREHVTVNVALAVVHDAARALAGLHALAEDDGSPAHLIHGNLGLDELVVSRRGESQVIGLEGRRGDLSVDVEALMSVMRALLATRAINPKGSALLDRLAELKFKSCAELARAIEVYLSRQDPTQLAQRRLRFTSAVLGSYREEVEDFEGEEPTAGELDLEGAVLRGGGEAVAVGFRIPVERADSVPSLDPRDMELLRSDDSAATPFVADVDVLRADTAETTAGDVPPEDDDLFGFGTVDSENLTVDEYDEAALLDPGLIIGPRRTHSEEELGFGRGVSAPPSRGESATEDELGEVSEEGEALAEAMEASEEDARAGLMGSAAPPDRSEPVGERADAVRVGDYRVVASIGRGGMGEIYLGREVKEGKLGGLVALKVLGSQGHLLERDEEALDMLLDEAKIMGHIHHPNVLKVVNFGKDHGRYFLATEYLEGRPLVRVMIEAYSKGGGMDYGLVAAIGADAAYGLHAAHSAVAKDGAPLKVVHRDVSPQNIFITYGGVTKVIDFGVARATERIAQTAVGLVKGKAAYMSPEQAEGRDVDARSDVFSLGVCLWEMIAGCRLFKRDIEYDTLLAVQSAPIEPPSVVRGKPNPVLDHIILNALARDRGRRTQSAKELAAQLADYARGQGIQDRAKAVAGLLDGLFREAKAKEQRLIRGLEERMASPDEVAQLEALSGVSQRGDVREITLVGAPDSLADLDDFGRKTTGSARVIQAVDRLQAERVGSILELGGETEVDPSEQGARPPTVFPAPSEAEIEDGFDGMPTRPLPADLVAQVRLGLSPPPAPEAVHVELDDDDDDAFEIVEAGGADGPAARAATAPLGPPPGVILGARAGRSGALVWILSGATVLALAVAGVLLWQMLPEDEGGEPTVALRTVADGDPEAATSSAAQAGGVAPAPQPALPAPARAAPEEPAPEEPAPEDPRARGPRARGRPAPGGPGAASAGAPAPGGPGAASAGAPARRARAARPA
jgi:serine/threonine protein kinase